MRTFVALLCSVVSLLALGCGMSRDAQLKAVARDWCMTIRSSQVIPVYPLTEDVHPGDVFLVQVPIDKQQTIYKRRGFLPLDNHIARLQPSGYQAFYEHSFLADPSSADLPYHWLKRSNPIASPANSTGAWDPAPRAAFPSYSFSVRRGAGLNVAVPVSGVPVGLSLLGTKSANGSISIDRSRTIGVDIRSMLADLQHWAAANREFLRSFEPDGTSWGTNYLRVVTRVYVAGKLDVALSDARSFSGGADVGVPRPVDLLSAKTPTSLADSDRVTLSNYTENLAALNAMLAESTSPTRASGSNTGLNAGSVDAKTAAKQTAMEEKRRTRLEAANTAETELVQKRRAATEATAARIAAEALVTERTEAVAALPEGDPGIPAAEAELAQAQQDVETTRQAEETAAAALGTAEVESSLASAALSQVMQALPGGSVRVTAASSRFIAMEEEFDPPLVFGYVGFDVPILAGGRIGPPIPTHARLDPTSSGRLIDSSEMLEALYIDGLDVTEYGRLRQAAVAGDHRAIRAVELLDALGRFVPASYDTYEAAAGGSLVADRERSGDSTYLDFRAYAAAIQTNANLFERRLNAGQPFEYTDADGDRHSVQPGSDTALRLANQVRAWRETLEDPELALAREQASLAAGDAFVRVLIGARQG